MFVRLLMYIGCHYVNNLLKRSIRMFYHLSVIILTHKEKSRNAETKMFKWYIVLLLLHISSTNAITPASIGNLLIHTAMSFCRWTVYFANWVAKSFVSPINKANPGLQFDLRKLDVNHQTNYYNTIYSDIQNIS
ncbi:unnamed protein product [Rhizopus stolonifer]